MTREEAINNIKEHCYFANLIPQAKEALDMAIKALEQESKSEWEHDHEILKAYSDGANGVLEELRAEIRALSPEPTAYDVIDGSPIKDAVWETLYDVLRIIDKYKVESEDKECRKMNTIPTV